MPLARLQINEVEEALASGSFARAPHRWYRILREKSPVYWSEFLGQWLVTSAELVEDVLLQPKVFSSFGFDTAFIGRLGAGDNARFATLKHHFEQRGLIQADPPDHTRLRRTLSRLFTSRSLESLQGTIESAVEQLLRDAPEDLDVIRDLAGPLPVSVIAELLGVPEQDRSGFPRWSASAVRFFGTPEPDLDNAASLDADLVEWRSLIFRLLEERRSAPLDDLLTVVAGHISDGEMTLEEALFTCAHLLIAGHETTTNLTGNGVFCLLMHPEVHREVVDEPSTLEAAIEEVLRFEPPIQRIRRVAVEAHELGGCQVKPGDPVIPVLASANRDPARYDDPDTFDIHRDFSSSPHLAFGRGVHFCIGAPLARLEALAGIGGILARFPTATLMTGYTPDWRATINLRGLQSLPIARLAGVSGSSL